MTRVKTIINRAVRMSIMRRHNNKNIQTALNRRVGLTRTFRQLSNINSSRRRRLQRSRQGRSQNLRT